MNCKTKFEKIQTRPWIDALPYTYMSLKVTTHVT